MTTRSRILSFGAAALLVVLGAVGAALFGSTLGQVVSFALIAVGLVLATGLVFLEVGLSEDRERAREAERAQKEQSAPHESRDPRSQEVHGGRRLGRQRGSRRRLE